LNDHYGRLKGNPMATKKRQERPDAVQKYPEQDQPNPDRRKRTNRPGEANIDHDNRRSGQQTEQRRPRGESDAVEGEGETDNERAKH
jgi:hypothetical protein